MLGMVYNDCIGSRPLFMKKAKAKLRRIAVEWPTGF